MSTKLTLLIDESVVADAKAYARESGKSLSKIIEGYMRGLRKKQKNQPEEELPPILKRLHGCIDAKNIGNYEEVIKEEIIKKYSEGR
ncbi:DUF6364 family protein [Sediminibacterium goheungense]|uniref:Antitoxin n=1 Tax=Sediminibacterium goheungense TaxID=1086393 RepID=A0A4V3C4T6_9BACT|nr:DUF6364 family protein [Sediminibacterium goheungense]TDO27178.1 hypothetical protein BC659_2497 [Sediminibacterium goheungense]